MDELLFPEEMMWLQRSRISWLNEGDRNTGFFHRRAKWRAKKNNVRRLKRQDGSFTKEPKEMKEMAANFFKDLYMTYSEVCPDLYFRWYRRRLHRR
jgi:hypothetical protein